MPYQNDGWSRGRIGKNIWKYFRTVSPHAITMTGAAVTTQLHIPFPHRWLRTTFYHTSSAYVENYELLSATIQRSIGTFTPAKFKETLFAETEITDPDWTELWGERFEYEAGVWDIILTAASTDLIFPLFYVQNLGD